MMLQQQPRQLALSHSHRGILRVMLTRQELIHLPLLRFPLRLPKQTLQPLLGHFAGNLTGS